MRTIGPHKFIRLMLHRLNKADQIFVCRYMGFSPERPGNMLYDTGRFTFAELRRHYHGRSNVDMGRRFNRLLQTLVDYNVSAKEAGKGYLVKWNSYHQGSAG